MACSSLVRVMVLVCVCVCRWSSSPSPQFGACASSVAIALQGKNGCRFDIVFKNNVDLVLSADTHTETNERKVGWLACVCAWFCVSRSLRGCPLSSLCFSPAACAGRPLLVQPLPALARAASLDALNSFAEPVPVLNANQQERCVALLAGDLREANKWMETLVTLVNKAREKDAQLKASPLFVPCFSFLGCLVGCCCVLCCVARLRTLLGLNSACFVCSPCSARIYVDLISLCVRLG